jgi:spectrin alpha
MNIRKQRLLDSLQVQQLFRDIEDEEAWIREKEPVAASTNRGRTDSFCLLYVFGD